MNYSKNFDVETQSEVFEWIWIYIIMYYQVWNKHMSLQQPLILILEYSWKMENLSLQCTANLLVAIFV